MMVASARTPCRSRSASMRAAIVAFPIRPRRSASTPARPPTSLPASLSAFTPSRRPTTFLDLPLDIRNRIYDEALFPDWLEDTEWGGEAKVGVPLENLGLLRVSRQVHKEAKAVLHATLFLGGNARLAKEYMSRLGAARIRQVRKLVLSYECHQDCHSTYGTDNALNWGPVFDLLYHWWACPQKVIVHHWSCNFRSDKVPFCTGEFNDNTVMEGECRTLYDEEHDTFWCGLQRLTMVEKMDFNDCPTFFMGKIARRNWWHALARSGCDLYGPYQTYTGALVNPAFPGEFDWTLRVHSLIEEGVDVSDMEYDPTDTSRHRSNDDPANEAEGTMVAAKPTLTFFDLPAEIRRRIFDYACVHIEKEYWPYHPRRWHSGTEVLAVSKRFAMEARPSMYRTIRLFAYDVFEPLVRLGARGCLTHARRLELYFSCHCANAWDRKGIRRTLCPQQPVDAEAALRKYGQLDIHVEPQERLRVLAMWRDAFAILSAEPLRSNIRDYDITMYSCQRCRCDAGTALHCSPSECAELEELFVELLAGLRPQMERLSLSGDVPPSLAVRLATETGGGPRMRLNWIDPAVRKFMANSLKAWRTEGCPVRGGPLARPDGEVWLNPVPHPDRTARRDTPEVFILAADTTAAGRWFERVEGGDAGQTHKRARDCPGWHDGPELERVGRYDLEELPPWTDLRDAWDYANVSQSEHDMRVCRARWKARSERKARKRAAAAAAAQAAGKPLPQDVEDEFGDSSEDEANDHTKEESGHLPKVESYDPPEDVSEDPPEDEYDRRWATRLAAAARVTPWADMPIWMRD